MDNDFLSQLSPEQMAQLLGMGTLDERGGIIEDQLKQAMALRQPSGVQHITGMGAGLGGLGDVLNRVGGGIQAHGLREQQQANLGKKDAGRQTFADLLRGMGQPPQGAPYQYPHPAGPELDPNAGGPVFDPVALLNSRGR